MARPVCVVTGSSSGIGAAIVEQFAAKGYDVVVHYNSGAERAEAIAAKIRVAHGGKVLVLGANLSQADAAFELVDRTFAHYGRLDVVISNSGVANYVQDERGQLARYRFDETPIEHLDKEMDRVLSLNLMGSYRLAQRALSTMTELAKKEREPAHRSILFITSISDIAPESTRIPYGVSKAGLNHAVIGAAFDGGPFNITVNALRPGVIDTPLTARPSGVEDPATGQEFTVAETYGLMAEGGAQPIRRIGEPADIAFAAYAFTQIPYMTGQLVAIDGGFTLHGNFTNRELFLQEGLRKRQPQ